MGPNLLGGGASLLAAAFILSLPSIFGEEPADKVEPIRFGPPPVARLAEAVRISSPPSRELQAPAGFTPSAAPVIVASEGAGERETVPDRGQGGSANQAAGGESTEREDQSTEDDVSDDDSGGEVVSESDDGPDEDGTWGENGGNDDDGDDAGDDQGEDD